MIWAGTFDRLSDSRRRISITLDFADFRWFCAGFSNTLRTKIQQFDSRV